jgi:signal transduction histidine kinase
MRRRLTGLAVLASGLAVLLFALPLAVAVARYLASDERGELQRVAATAAASVHGELTPEALSANPALHGEQAVTMYGPAGTRLFGPGPELGGPVVSAALAGRAENSTAHGRLTASAAISDGDAVIAAVTVSTPVADLRRRIMVAWAEMAAAALLAVAVTGCAARRYSRRLSEPLEQLADTARRIGDGERDARAAPSPIPEVATLSGALHDSADRLRAAYDRERQFTADASHQLRTPLAGLRLELETALIDTTADPHSAMLRALAAADEIQATIETLLALARDQPGSTADVGTSLDQLRDRWTGRLAAGDRPLRIDVQRDADRRVRCSQGALDQILDVLLDNATRHGTGVVTLTARPLPGALALDVSNPGPAIATPAHELFRRRSTQAHGHGIGLSLARSLAEADGARLVLTSASPPTFTLLIPAEPPDSAEPPDRAEPTQSMTEDDPPSGGRR